MVLMGNISSREKAIMAFTLSAHAVMQAKPAVSPDAAGDKRAYPLGQLPPSFYITADEKLSFRRTSSRRLRR